MIDFSPAYNEGLIVHCRTVEESLDLFREAEAELRDTDHNLSVFTEDLIRRSYQRYGDRMAYRFHVFNNGYASVTHSPIDWYRERECYKSYKIVEYGTEIVDYGTISDDQIDISYLLNGG